MRKQIWLPVTILLAICCVVLLWHHISERQKPETPHSGLEGGTNQLEKLSQPKPAQNSQNLHSATPPNFQSGGPIPKTPLEESNAAYQKIISVWQAPIDFYGKVVDENSNAVAGAQVTFHWTETPDTSGNRTATTESDSDGLFSLHGAHGPSLAVSVAKEGYYSSREKDHPPFKYGSFAMGNFSPDPANPVIFHLWKKGKGEALIRSDFPRGIGQIAQLPHDGTAIGMDLFNAQKVKAGTGQLDLAFWRDVTQVNAKTFNWWFQISVSGGGLIKTDDEFAFEAPQTGYQPSFVIDMPATNANWYENVTSRFYLQLPDGKFGRIDLNFSGYNGVFTVKSVINPSGSRNLEIDPNKVIQQPQQE